MENILGLILLIVFGAAGLLSIFTVVNLMLPALVEQVRIRLELSLGRSLLLGLVNSVLAGILVGLLSLPTRAGGLLAGVFGFLIGLVALMVIALLLLGLVSAASLLGSRIGSEASPMGTQLRGGLLLLLACLTPFLGWWFVTPLVFWTAFGAAIQIVVRRSPRIAQPGS